MQHHQCLIGEEQEPSEKAQENTQGGEYAKENLEEEDVMVIIMPDHGTRYLGKVYNDNWMKDHGFTETGSFPTARDIVAGKNAGDGLFTINSSTKIGDAIQTMNARGIDQAPVVGDGEFVGSISDAKILKALIGDPALKNRPISQIMDASFKFIALDNTVDVISKVLDKDTKGLLVRDDQNKVHILTQTDLLMSLTK